jgi:excisionase family DNA binding protein
MAQAIRFSSVGELMLRRWVKEGKLRLYKVSKKKVLIDKAELETAIRANAVLNGD